MSRECEVTGKIVRFGNRVSHSNNKSRREFRPNLQKKAFFVPEEGRWVTLKLTAKAIKTVAKNGIFAVLKEMREKRGIVK